MLDWDRDSGMDRRYGEGGAGVERQSGTSGLIAPPRLRFRAAAAGSVRRKSPTEAKIGTRRRHTERGHRDPPGAAPSGQPEPGASIGARRRSQSVGSFSPPSPPPLITSLFFSVLHSFFFFFPFFLRWFLLNVICTFVGKVAPSVQLCQISLSFTI